jgi:hypothetical protein
MSVDSYEHLDQMLVFLLFLDLHLFEEVPARLILKTGHVLTLGLGRLNAGDTKDSLVGLAHENIESFGSLVD